MFRKGLTDAVGPVLGQGGSAGRGDASPEAARIPSRETPSATPTPSRDTPSRDTPGTDNAEVTTISDLVVMQPYLDNVEQVVRTLLAEETNGKPTCYSLVDGNNVIYEQGNNFILRTQLINEANKCLPPETRSQVIVVWPQFKWDKLGANGMTPQTFARLFDPLRQGTSVYFALVDYPKPNPPKDGHVYLPNGTKKYQPWCQLPGMQSADHLACELDDAILTELHCAITRNNRCAIAVSGDRRVIKTREDLDKLKGWVDAALKTRNFYVRTTFKKVTVGSVDSQFTTLLGGAQLA